MSNIITFRGSKPAAAHLLDLWHEIEPWEPEYWSTKENIIRITEDLMDRDHIRAAIEAVTEIREEYPDLAKPATECLDALRACDLDCLHLFDAQVQYFNDEGYGPTTRVWILYTNHRSGKADLRLYQNRAAAKGQVTKFFHRVLRCSN